jgi:hypothetical protein
VAEGDHDDDDDDDDDGVGPLSGPIAHKLEAKKSGSVGR